MSKAAEILREVAYPFMQSTVLFALSMFFLLIEFAFFGGVLGLILLLLVVPALVRYLMLLLEVRANGRDAEPPGIEMFSFFGNAWSLFPVVIFVVLIVADLMIARRLGTGWAAVFGVVVAVLLPASLSVLAMTHSPVESLNPRPVVGLIRRCGADYWLLPAFIIAGGLLLSLLAEVAIPDFVAEFIGFYLLFAIFAVTGRVLARHGLARDIDIPAPVDADLNETAGERERQRRKVLNHAYGFISRDNRRGGLAHIYQWLDEDPDPDTAWPWFFNEMLRWEVNEAALAFAQLYLSRLLRYQEFVPAVKLMMRCREINAAFRPLPDDRLMAIAAAESCHNDELIALLK